MLSFSREDSGMALAHKAISSPGPLHLCAGQSIAGSACRRDRCHFKWTYWYVNTWLWFPYLPPVLKDDQYIRKHRVWRKETNVQAPTLTKLYRASELPAEDKNAPVLLHRLGRGTQERVEQKSTASVPAGMEEETRQKYERRWLLRVSDGTKVWKETKTSFSQWLLFDNSAGWQR